jgi:putative protease
MRIVAKMHHLTELETFMEMNLDVFLLETPYAKAAKHPFSMDDIKGLTASVHRQGKKVYLLMDRMIHEGDLSGITGYLSEVSSFVDGIVLADITVAIILQKLGAPRVGIYQPGPLNTHHHIASFVQDLGMRGWVLAPELTLSEIESITSVDSGVEIGFQGFGHIEMFHTRRHLLTSFFTHEAQSFDPQATYFLKEASRQEYYPIIESEEGTTIYRPIMSSRAYLDRLRACIDDVYLMRLDIDDDTYFQQVKAYLTGDFSLIHEEGYSIGYLEKMIDMDPEVGS